MDLNEKELKFLMEATLISDNIMEDLVKEASNPTHKVWRSLLRMGLNFTFVGMDCRSEKIWEIIIGYIELAYSLLPKDYSNYSYSIESIRMGSHALIKRDNELLIRSMRGF